MEEEFPYRVFIVRCWRERGEETAVWRFVLENPVTREQMALTDLAGVKQAIHRQLHKTPAAPAAKDETERGSD